MKHKLRLWGNIGRETLGIICLRSVSIDSDINKCLN